LVFPFRRGGGERGGERLRESDPVLAAYPLLPALLPIRRSMRQAAERRTDTSPREENCGATTARKEKEIN